MPYLPFFPPADPSCSLESWLFILNICLIILKLLLARLALLGLE